jgi:hypothetical protein
MQTLEIVNTILLTFNSLFIVGLSLHCRKNCKNKKK